MESKIMACKKCTEELGVYATSFQHGCYECWKLLQETIKANDAEKEEYKSKYISMKSLLKDICDEWNEKCEGTCNSYGHDEKCCAVNIANAKRKQNKAIAEARTLIAYSVECNECEMGFLSKAKAWLENNC